MSGKPINSEQVKVYMEARAKNTTQKKASARSGISERSGRRIDNGELQPAGRGKRYWRTRKDPFRNVWDNEIVPLLEKESELTPVTLFEQLQKDYPGEYPDSKLRTFQRKVRKWKALYGADREVMFRQHQVIGRMGISDFTKLKQFDIRISGVIFHHLLYHFRLAFSGWCSVKVVHGGESFSAFAQGLQDALQRLGGSPHEHRSDSLSAAFKNLKKEAEEDATSRYHELCKHYGMEASRNNRGKGHENGSIESPHGHLKKRIHQALLLRGSNDFETVAAYEEFLSKIVATINRNKKDKVEEERRYLQPLPLHRTVDYTEKVVRVSTSSTIRVNGVLYTVPSRLIGESLRVHIYDNRLDIYLGSTFTETLKRLFGRSDGRRVRQVNYCHVIASLERKPQAFRYSQLRDDLLPNATYKAVWDLVDRDQEARKACRTMVGILALAHKGDCEERLGEYLLTILSSGKPFPGLYELQQRFAPRQSVIPSVTTEQHSTEEYDQLLSMADYSREVH
ncbi:MAG: IS21 family transposase [Desulfocapsa sp.]|uniref:IS21 family transposase n=1 Tax=Desulfotalea psychrophila TaxID=84980 RepID=A0ABS3ATS7_9BACT|nr:IS21 family transposase [Desulfocapsa sp.]MBL4901297.1 IS21 family transposase [Desulfocapsa sp.]MBN4068510.1 IS21 family transposase [Desulfotalea psychrophila]